MALNTDVLMLIIEYLDFDDLHHLASTCRLLNIIVCFEIQCTTVAHLLQPGTRFRLAHIS